MGNSSWSITVVTESTEDFSGRSLYNLDKIDTLTKHTFGQMFYYVRAFYKTRGGAIYTRLWDKAPIRNLKPSWEQQTSMELIAWAWFNFTNEPDFEWHIDEAFMLKHYKESLEGSTEEYSKWDGSIYGDELKKLEMWGIDVLRVYRPRPKSGVILIETVYIKLDKED